MACSKLEEIANAKRAELLAQNVYNTVEGNIYSAVHPNATQATGDRDPKNIRGKGTGVKFDTTSGGSSIDINGDPRYQNTGRIAIYSNKYNPDNQYDCVIE